MGRAEFERRFEENVTELLVLIKEDVGGAGELSVSPDGSITLCYNDGDMFWGHAVEVDASVSGEIADAHIVG